MYIYVQTCQSIRLSVHVYPVVSAHVLLYECKCSTFMQMFVSTVISQDQTLQTQFTVSVPFHHVDGEQATSIVQLSKPSSDTL